MDSGADSGRRPSLAAILGLADTGTSHVEKLVATAGGVIGILCVAVLSRALLDGPGAVAMVASMGATATLLFAVPSGPLSQPWSVMGGHLVSALVGVTCARLVGDPVLAGALAVGLAIGAMHYLRCIHPPGGATALFAVLGGPAVDALGYGYVLAPVALNAAVLVLVAVAFNYPFRWRRYPRALAVTAAESARPSSSPYPDISHAQLVAALSQIDSIVDISERDLLRIYELATQRPHPQAGDRS